MNKAREDGINEREEKRGGHMERLKLQAGKEGAPAKCGAGQGPRDSGPRAGETE